MAIEVYLQFFDYYMLCSHFQGYQERIHVRADEFNAMVHCFIETYSGQWKNDAWWGWGVLCASDGEVVSDVY